MLFFTEYKATQALLINALSDRFGYGAATFINGDGHLEGVRIANGPIGTISQSRTQAAARFNRGEVRFLVSTEAAGERIDLQENCHTLIHVDLPWNPMRRHQRVGRLSRTGQTGPVDVVTIRNPDTVESRIWECLDRKLDRIALAFQGAMDDPEDMPQRVIGMASPRMVTRVFADADPALEGGRLREWFDAETASFGGQDAVETVRSLFGNVPRFDFGAATHQILKVDLGDLAPFMQSALTVLGRRPPQTDADPLAFCTPTEWMDDFTIAERYEVSFARERPLGGQQDLGGVGLRVVDRGLQWAADTETSVGTIGGLEEPIVVFAIRDQLTGEEGAVRQATAGAVRTDGDGKVLRDWELRQVLNRYADRPRSAVFEAQEVSDMPVWDLVSAAEQAMRRALAELDLPFRRPEVQVLACLIPARRQQGRSDGQP